jgi:hypothetical protein
VTARTAGRSFFSSKRLRSTLYSRHPCLHLMADEPAAEPRIGVTGGGPRAAGIGGRPTGGGGRAAGDGIGIGIRDEAGGSSDGRASSVALAPFGDGDGNGDGDGF